MTIEEILQLGTVDEVIEELKNGRGTERPDVEKAEKALDPKKHDVFDITKRPDEEVVVDERDDDDVDANNEAKKEKTTKTEKVARIALSLQKLIIARAAAFLFGTPVKYYAKTISENQKTIKKAFDRIVSDNKLASLDRTIAKTIFGYKECAELWYSVPADHDNYGFRSSFKLRCALFSPKNGDVLYPYFDDTGDMIAFSREFVRKDAEGEEVSYFETYTDSQHLQWVESENGMVLVDSFPKANVIGKIPVVYGMQENFETEDVDSLIDRLETLLSNFADTNDYHGSPTIIVKGLVLGFAQKGKAGKILQLTKGDDRDSMQPDAQYLTWEHAPESIKLEIETLLRMIHTLTQTPDISFDTVKGLGAISGIALKLLFMDAHLKVMDKQEIFDAYLTRRANIIKAFIGQFNLSLKQESDIMDIDPEITPYIITNEIDDANFWITANGGKPLISQKESAANANLSSNAEEDFTQMQKEAEASSFRSVTEPTY
ncbi:MAG: phage portal protein [Prevotellaceae bacterium]|jgi:SPP1 family phage portal protein|nr:phage portal protein [Prevotellaceae bacterium]